MYSCQTHHSPFFVHFEDITQLPQLFPVEDNDHDEPMRTTILDFFGTYSPIMMVPQRIKRKKVYIEVSLDRACVEGRPVEGPKEPKCKKQKKWPIDFDCEVIKEEADNAEFFNEEDLIASSCCRGDHCHHYAYSSPNCMSYVAFLDNFFNGMIPNLFVSLQVLYKEIHKYFSLHPLDLQSLRCLLDYYGRTLKNLGLRMLNCTCCLIDILHEFIDMHECFLEESEYRALSIAEAIDFFVGMDTTLLELIILRDYNSDIEETVNPVENFVYQTVYSYLVTYMRGLYFNVSELTRATFSWHIHNDLVEGVPNARIRVLHLGYVAEKIQEKRRLMFVRFDDEVNSTRFVYDGTYVDGFEDWQEFREVYLNGSLTDHRPKTWERGVTKTGTTK